MDSKILIVDDSMTDRMIINNILSDYQTLMASNGLEAIEQIEKDPDIDLIILDLNMPKMNGFELLKWMKNEPNHSKIVTLILTNYDEMENEILGLELGAVDYIRKPLNIESLKKRIEVHLNLKIAQKNIERYNSILEETVDARTHELVVTRDVTIHALIGLLEVRNIESSNHTVRTQWIMKRLCEHLSTKEKYSKLLTEDYINELFKTAPLHDIGKVGIPDSILLKPGRLTIEEFEIMKNHTTYGVEALSHEIGSTDIVPSFVKTAIEIAGTHHERFDGSGYPNGLSGTDIPLPGRLMAIIDVYDALMSKRVYKPAYEFEDTVDMLMKERGKHFDPELLDAFLEVKDQIHDLSMRYMQDNDEG
ncbi:MAG: response regulator [Bacillota bacterium]|nr:response regulator [Bacillota bacterium]